MHYTLFAQCVLMLTQYIISMMDTNDSDRCGSSIQRYIHIRFCGLIRYFLISYKLNVS